MTPSTKLNRSGISSSQSSMMKTEADIQLYVVAVLLGLEQIERSTARDEEQGMILKLTLNGQVLHRPVIFPDGILIDWILRVVFFLYTITSSSKVILLEHAWLQRKRPRKREAEHCCKCNTTRAKLTIMP